VKRGFRGIVAKLSLHGASTFTQLSWFAGCFIAMPKELPIKNQAFVVDKFAE
jgi:hypothetical protein